MAVKNSIKVGLFVFFVINVCHHGEHYETPCIIILWYHGRICDPSLTETSLCGAYLYNKNPALEMEHKKKTSDTVCTTN